MAKTKGNGQHWQADKIVRWPIADLLPYARNPKTHPAKQVELLARSIQKFGFINPVFVDGDPGKTRGEIIAGHGRVLAAEQLGQTHVPVIEAHGWSDEDKRAYRIADNELGSLVNAPYDVELLKLEVQDLKLLGYDMPLLGFQNIELVGLLSGSSGAGDPDAQSEIPKNPFVAPGDLWTLGEHRLLCGDATSEKDVSLLFGGESPRLMVTDPPYGVNYDPGWREESNLNAWAQSRMTGAVVADHKHDWTPAWMLFPGDVAYIWHAGRFAAEVQLSIMAAGFNIRSQIIWRKPHFAIGRGDYHWQHEPCWYAVRKGKKSHWQGGRKQTTVWDILGFQVAGGHRDEAKTGHGTQKPLDCMQRPIINNSKEGDGVYDPFIGSGTTIIAAEVNGRRCFGMEIDPAYTQLCIERWQQFSGKQAMLDGRTFAEVREDRNAKGRRGKSIRGSNARASTAKRVLSARRNARQPEAG